MFSATSDAKLAGENTWDQSTLDSSTQTSMTKVAMEDTEEETKDK